MREWIVTLHNKEDLDSFYEDMETPGGNLHIPDRAVDVAHRRPISRNTHYYLTDEEAQQVSLDPRVMSVELNYEDAGVVIRPASNNRISEELENIKFEPNYTQTSSNFSKSNTISSNMINWALLRSTEGQQRSNWGVDGTASQSGTITVNASGKNVDVVIVDGHINPAHPEFAVNSDGTGGSRIIQYNWFELTPNVTGGSAGTYVYTPYTGSAALDDDNDHGAHVGGTVAGNTQGWARDSNIYNISPYGTNPSFTGFFLDYVRYWHNNKPINPVTGRRNPTITNHSYGLKNTTAISNITSLRFRGTVYTQSFTGSQLSDYGLENDGTDASWDYRSTAFEQDLIDMINDGIIVVGSAGNNANIIDNPSASSSADYNNYFISSGVTHYYMRGTITAAAGIICVGSIGPYYVEDKSNFSACGPRITVWAPGGLITSPVNTTSGATDPRNASYYITKKSGTSMASPQVSGVLACLAESWPRMRQQDAINWLVASSKPQVYDNVEVIFGGTSLSNPYSLKGATSAYLYFAQPRKSSGSLYPRDSEGNRPSSGQVFPRPKIYRYGR